MEGHTHVVPRIFKKANVMSVWEVSEWLSEKELVSLSGLDSFFRSLVFPEDKKDQRHLLNYLKSHEYYPKLVEYV